MRRLTGGTLTDLLAAGPLDHEALAHVVSRVGGALATAADLGIVHGRVTPNSVLYDASGRAHLTDFALVPADPAPTAGDDVHDFAALIGACMGPRAPEQVARLVAPGTGLVDRPVMADLVTLLLASLTADRADPTVPPPDPYKGLRAFAESDAGDFFGRADLVEHVVERLRGEGIRSRLVLVVGGSGSRKSSLARAGIVPAVRRGDVQGRSAGS